MRHSIILLLAICGVLGSNGACTGQTAPGERRPSPHLAITTHCTFEQRAQLEQALQSICRAAAQSDGRCHKVLAHYRLLASFRRQCQRGLTVRCIEPGCGQYLRKQFFYRTDDGTIEIGLGGMYGGAGCGGREHPMLGPAHTLAHEMAHAAGVVSDIDAEQVAYACRGQE